MKAAATRVVDGGWGGAFHTSTGRDLGLYSNSMNGRPVSEDGGSGFSGRDWVSAAPGASRFRSW